MFEMLTGQLPFSAESQAALALKHIQEQPPLVGDVNPAVPEQLELIVAKVLAKEPSGRYRTAGQLGRVLSTYRSSSQAETGPVAAYEVETLAAASVPISEQKTQIFPKPVRTAETGPAATDPATAVYSGTDWMAIGLGIIAILALLGLIPLWYFVYISYAG